MILGYNALKRRTSECFDLNIKYSFQGTAMEASFLIHHYNYPNRKTFFTISKLKKQEFIEEIIDVVNQEPNLNFGHFTYNNHQSVFEWIMFDNKKTKE